MAVTLLTKAAYARHRGCDEKAVRKAIEENRISLIDGKIDPAVADIQWAQNTRARAGAGRQAGADLLGDGAGAPTVPSTPTAALPAPTGSAPGYQDHRARTEAATAEMKEMEAGKMAGRLIVRNSTERAIFDTFRQLRDAVMASAPRAAPKVIGMNDSRDIERILTDELRKSFDGWEAQMLERLPTKDAT